MKKAVGYVRISDSDQSNWSIDGQEKDIRRYCERNGIELLTIFRDDGQSAKNFDRASWRELETFIKKYYREIDHLLVIAYDRFSRNVSEALNMMNKIEKTYGIDIVSITQPIALHPDSPYYFQFRAQMLLGAELELRVIRDRTKTGRYRAAREGRFSSKAPYGYINSRDEQKKPLLIIDKKKKHIVKRIFDLFLAGLNHKQIHRIVAQEGFTLKNNNVIKVMLSNPVYAGLIKVPAHYDDPETIVKGVHQGIVSESIYWRIQAKLNNKLPRRRGDNAVMPLKGVVKHSCDKLLTASRSKGKCNYFWYYVCMNCKKNISAKKMHDQLLQIISHFNMSEADISRIADIVAKAVTARLASHTQDIERNKKDLKAAKAKLHGLEEKYLENDIDKDSYRKWRAQIKNDIAIFEDNIVSLNVPAARIWAKYEEKLLLLQNLSALYEKASLAGKQLFLNMVFDNNLYHDGLIYRTPYIVPIYLSKVPILNEKGLLILEQPVENLKSNLLSATEEIRTPTPVTGATTSK